MTVMSDLLKADVRGLGAYPGFLAMNSSFRRVHKPCASSMLNMISATPSSSKKRCDFKEQLGKNGSVCVQKVLHFHVYYIDMSRF